MTWMPGGHNDWFSVSVSEPNFRLRFNRTASKVYQNFDDAAGQAAQLLYKDWGDRPLYLALSGGIDSELVAKTLLKNKIPFTPVILKVGIINQIEAWYAEYWCYSNNITPIVLEYSIDEYTNKMAEFGPKLHRIKNYNITSVFLIYEYVHQLGGYGIYCGGDINFDFERKEFFCASLDFVSNLVDVGDHPTSFFMYTPELALSYINQFDINKTEQFNKLSFYQVAPRPKIDYLLNIYNTTQYQNAKKQIFYLLKIDHSNLPQQRHWYGTKEQIAQDLQP